MWNRTPEIEANVRLLSYWQTVWGPAGRGPPAWMRRRRWHLLMGCAALAVGGYASYRIYISPLAVASRRLFAASVDAADAVREASACVALLCNDLRSFLVTENNEIPRSFRQVMKLGRSEDFRETVVAVTGCLIQGALDPLHPASRDERSQGPPIPSENGEDSEQQQEGLSDKVLRHLANPGFASAVVGAAARNVVIGVLEGMESSRRDQSHQLNCRFDRSPGRIDPMSEDSEERTRNGLMWGCTAESILDIVSGSRGQAIISGCILTFVGTAVTVYLKETSHVNVFEDIAAAVTKPDYREPLEEMLKSVSGVTVRTLITTIHEVCVSQPSSSFPAGSESTGIRGEISSFREDTNTNQASAAVHRDEDLPSWCSRLSQTLSVPSNRQLVMDVMDVLLSVTATQTSKVVRSVGLHLQTRLLALIRMPVIFTVILAVCLHTVTLPLGLAGEASQRGM